MPAEVDGIWTRRRAAFDTRFLERLADDEAHGPMTNPYLAPVSRGWARAGGIALLLAAVALTAALALGAIDLLGQGASRRFTSSTLIFGLVLLVLCGICWQAGYRLAFRRPDHSGTLFSRPAWLAIGTGLVAINLLMAVVIARGRGLTLLDVQVILFLGGIGVWCLLLAMRGARR